ncbi:MAG TPA: nitrate ABC transporter, partial [Thalassospira sp.]|nr:nitrate ABC transporter [Thalassospira sp.]
MTRMKLDKFCLVAAIAALLALIFPLSGIDSDTGKQVAFVGDIPGLAIAMALCVITGAAFTWLGVRSVKAGMVILAVAVFGCWQAVD